MPVAEPIAWAPRPSSLRIAGIAMAMLVRSMNDSTYITKATPRMRTQRLRRGANDAVATNSPSAPVAAQVLFVLPHQVMRAEIGDLGRADLRHADVDLAPEDAERGFGARDATRRHTIERRPALEHELGTHAQRNDGVEAAADAAVEHHRHLVADRLAD